MAIKEEDLVRLMDAYMGCDGYYMKPKIEEDGKSSFFIAKDTAKSSDVGASFELVRLLYNFPYRSVIKLKSSLNTFFKLFQKPTPPLSVTLPSLTVISISSSPSQVTIYW